MPLTSLASQLKKLQTPQDKLLIHRKARPSFLFDAKEAANFDRDTYYELGLSGLEELKKLNPYFSPFEDTLFDITSKNFERSIQTEEVNEKLNHNIKTFLLLLSPYFLIRSAHKALEWLINRYHVQDFNADELMMCALPYHETMTFARLIQLLPSVGRWHWLAPARSTGGPLPKRALLARASSDQDFLRFICDIPRHAIKVHGNKASSLTTLYAFYCSTVVGGLMDIKQVDSGHITNVLPSITRGLSSSAPDYTAAVFVVVGVLATRTLLAEDVIKALYNKISKVDHAKLRTETCLTLIILSQCETGDCIPDKAVVRLASALWLPAAIEHWTGKGIASVRLLTSLIASSLRMSQESGNSEEIATMKKFLKRLLDINFDEEDAYYVFRCILKNLKDPDSEFKDIVIGLETRYPSAFDKVCSEMLKTKDKEAEMLKKLLNITTSRSDLVTRLMHPESSIRCSALEFIAKECPSHQANWLANAVVLRLEDSKIMVVKAALKCKDVLNSADPQELVHPAIKCLTTGWTQDTTLILPSISLFSKCPDAAVPGFLFATIPVSFISPEIYERKVLKEERFKSLPIIKTVNEKIKSGTQLKKAIWETIVDGAWPPISGQDDSTLTLQSLCEIHPAYRALAFVVYAKVPEMHQYLSITDYINAGNIDIDGWKGSYSQKVSEDDFDAWLKIAQNCNLPVGAVLYFVSHFAVGFDLENDDDRWFDPVTCDRLVKAFVTLVGGSTVKKKTVKTLFEKATNEFLKGKFPEPRERLDFLLTVALASESAAVSVKCVQLAVHQIENASVDTTTTLLICLLASPHREVRKATLAAVQNCPKPYPFSTLFTKIIGCQDEIILDPNQIIVFAYSNLHADHAVESLLKKLVREAMEKCRKVFVDILASPSTPIFIKARLLRVLECVSSKEILTECFPKTVCRLVGNKSIFDNNQSAVMRGLISKLGEMHSPLLTKDSSLWDCIDDVLFDSFTEMDGNDENKKTCPSAYFLNHIPKEFFDKLPDASCQQHFVEMIISRSYNCNSSAVAKAVTGFFRRVVVDGQIFANILTQMKDASATHLQKPPTKIRKSLSDIPRLEVLETVEWKKGVFLLEQLQTLKRFPNVDVLLTVVFDILAKCLLFEEQLAVEYPKQLALSLVVKACGKTTESPRPQQSTLRTDLVVQCIRASQDPQTHHHALLALTVIADIVPDQVLHNIMDIFTFIGSTVLRQDDAYSLQIIGKLVEIIIPFLIKDGKKETMVGVIRVFVAAMLDVPEHRRLTLFLKLLTTIGLEQSLWIFAACVLESHTNRSSQQPTTTIIDPKKKSGEGQIPKKLVFALQVCLEFPLEIVLKTISKLLKHAIEMPHDKDDSTEINLSPKLLAIFDVKKNTAKQLRNYKYILVLFLSSIVSSDQFIRMMATASEKGELTNLQSEYAQLVRFALSYVRMVLEQNVLHPDGPSSKYWKVMLSNSYDLFDKIIWLMPEEDFAELILSLVTFSISGDEGLKRKVLELLGFRLSQGKPMQASVLLPLFKPIQSTALSPFPQPVTRQAALFAAKLLIRHLAADNIDQFKPMLVEVTDNLRAENESPEVLGSLALCLGELVFALKAHSIAQLSNFVPQLLHLITTTQSEIILLGFITALQKIVETLFNFLSPYLSRILYCICSLTVEIEESSVAGEQKSQTAQHLLQRLKSIRSTLSSGVSGRVIIPSVATCYAQLVAEASKGDENRLKAVSPLMSTLADSFQTSAELSNDLTQFFLNALSFRADASYGSWKHDAKLKVLCPERPLPPSSAVVEVVEPHVIATVTALVLKLSESSFRPLYHRLYDWAVRSSSRARIITFYRLSSALASCLRGLFVLFAGLFVTHAAEVLQSHTQTAKFVDDAQLLVDSILKTLLAVFSHDSHNFLTKDRFNSLMQPLVDQLEIEAGLENYEERCKELLTPCIAHMAAATSDDSLWKHLNYQVLLKTRHQSPQVRLASLETVCAITVKLGEDFLPLLPETVPFLAELLEDSDENVEKRTHRIISSMETVLGEPIQKYF